MVLGLFEMGCFGKLSLIGILQVQPKSRAVTKILCQTQSSVSTDATPSTDNIMNMIRRNAQKKLSQVATDNPKGLKILHAVSHPHELVSCLLSILFSILKRLMNWQQLIPTRGKPLAHKAPIHLPVIRQLLRT